MKAPSAFVLICLFSSCLNYLTGATYTVLISDFTSSLDNWGGGSDSTLSTVDSTIPGDSYLRKAIDLDGNGGQEAKMVIRRPKNSNSINSDPWLGDFQAREIQSVQLDFSNWSVSDTIYLRLALSDVANPMITTGTWWVSKTFKTFAPESGWGSASFNISESEMKRVGDFNGGFGTDSFTDTISDIKGFRFIASSAGDSALGDGISGVIGMDNVRLISTIPEPSRSAVIMGLLVAISLLRRRRR